MFEIRQSTFLHDSEEGISIERIGKYRFVYHTFDEKVMVVFTEPGIGTKGEYVEMVALPKLLKWEAPHNHPVSSEEREKIKLHLKEALSLVGGKNSRVDFYEE